jgi:hypothetical protein
LSGAAVTPLSLRGYAAHRKTKRLAGGSLQAVQRAIESGRLRTSVVTVDGLPRIADPELADREWADNTDQTRRARPDDADAEDSEATEGSFAYWKTKKMELDYRRAAAELVNAADMQAAMADAFSTVRTKLLGVPSKAKQRLPHLTLDDLATLEEIVRESLETIASGA